MSEPPSTYIVCVSKDDMYYWMPDGMPARKGKVIFYSTREQCVLATWSHYIWGFEEESASE